jgi:hypothetical protein
VKRERITEKEKKKMKKIALIIFFLLVTTSSYAGNKIDSVGTLTLGMTFKQVESAIGKKLEADPLASFYHYYRPDGTEVSVWFKDNKLVQIRLVYKEKRLEKTDTALGYFHEVREKFTAQWGTPTKFVKQLVVWEEGAHITVLRLIPPEKPYLPPALKLVVSSDKSSFAIKSALEGF